MPWPRGSLCISGLLRRGTAAPAPAGLSRLHLLPIPPTRRAWKVP